jgi:hypothetical protein
VLYCDLGRVFGEPGAPLLLQGQHQPNEINCSSVSRVCVCVCVCVRVCVGCITVLSSLLHAKASEAKASSTAFFLFFLVRSSSSSLAVSSESSSSAGSGGGGDGGGGGGGGRGSSSGRNMQPERRASTISVLIEVVAPLLKRACPILMICNVRYCAVAGPGSNAF